MKVLIAYASRHGSTEEIAQAIADGLRHEDISVHLRPVEQITTLEEYDGVVLGSAVYAGHWLPEAHHFVRHYWKQLVAMPVWLFSSGPIGAENSQAYGDPQDALDLVQQIGAREHRNFAGKLDRHQLSYGERFITRIVRAPAGDFRDWDAVQAWAAEIAGGAQAPQPEGPLPAASLGV